MVRMSDILRRQEEPDNHKKPEEQKNIPTPQTETESISKEEKAASILKVPRQEETKSSSPGISLKEASLAVIDRVKLGTRQETEAFYYDMIKLIKEILSKGLKDEPIEGKVIQDQVSRIADQIALGNDELMDLSNTSTSDNYLYGHSVNVCILAIKLGLGLGYNKSELIELATAAFLHDIGMIKVTNISEQKRKLTKEEYNKIKEHPIYGVDILKSARDISKVVIYVAHQHHERIDGSGYPRGIKGNQIDEYARIIAIIDAYEALTHYRSYRDKLLPYEAIREILLNKDRFDFRFIKALIEQICIYPIGSWVQLSTGEIGRVTTLNKSSPLRPTVKIMFDPQGMKLEEPKSTDVSKHPTIYIKKAVDEQEIKSKLAEPD